MNTNEKIHIELFKSLKRFSEIYIPTNSHNHNKNSNHYQKHSHEKIDIHRFSQDLKKIKKLNINFNSPKHDHKHRYRKSIQLPNNFHEKEFYNNDCYKTPVVTIKINLVNQKFKIADNFNEKNSNQFLKEKDECLKEKILSDKIEEEEPFSFYDINENKNITELSFIRKTEYNNREDSIKFLSGLIEDLK